MKAFHSSGVNSSTPPVGLLVSWTATQSPTKATSPQLPGGPLDKFFRHGAGVRSELFMRYAISLLRLDFAGKLGDPNRRVIRTQRHSPKRVKDTPVVTDLGIRL